jgi:hypothetical protein
MPAINVAKTDTFESQRQKINQIGAAIFNISQGGSDLSTGNLKLGDGSSVSPSLSFITDNSLGIYKSDSQTFSISSNAKKVFDFSNFSHSTYRNFTAVKSSLETQNIAITSYGQNYDAGLYNNVILLGGSGTDGSANITVESYIGQITNDGYGYLSPGNYTSIPLAGGSGNNAVSNFTINSIQGTISSPGSGYTDDIYLNVPLTTNGTGVNATANVSIFDGLVTEFVIDNSGSGYQNGDTLSFAAANVGGTGSGFLFTITNSPSEISDFSFVTKGSGYLTNEILTLPSTVSNVSTNLKGSVTGVSTTLSTDSTTITVTSTAGIVQGMLVTVDSGLGELFADTTVTTVNSSTELTLSTNPVTNGSAVLNFVSPGNANEIVVPNTTFIIVGSSVSQTSGTGTLGSNVTVTSVNISTNTVTLSSAPSIAGTAVLSFVPPWGTPSTQFQYTIGNLGVITSFSISGGGYGYQENDVLSINSFDLTQPTTYSVIIDDSGSGPRYYINTGTGAVEVPDLTLYVGNTYIFDVSDSSNNENNFRFSEFPGGEWGSSLIENISTNLIAGSFVITVTDTTGILPGMAVTVSSGTGQLTSNTFVESVDSSTEITISKAVFSSGAAVLKFNGTSYTDGVTTSNTAVSIKITNTTPSTLYYYSTNNSNLGGSIGQEGVLTIDLNNPKIFGSGFSGLVSSISLVDVVSINVESGNIDSTSLSSTTANLTNITSTSISSQSLSASSITTPSISTSGNLSLDCPAVNLFGDLNVSSYLTVNSSNGNLTTSGYLKTTNILNVNDILSISNNVISTVSDTSIILTPPDGRVVKVNNSTAITIPSGNTSQRPPAPIAESGSIRFNIDTNQYEGYSSSTSSWSSLGGVRDLDGNTYITAEESIGSNDNRLWFYNDNNNTVRFTTEYQEFITVKKIRSLNVSAPSNTNWTSSTPVTTGQYLKYRNNIYEVISGGTTGTSGNEPTDVTGNTFSNGTTTLRYFTSAVAPLTFEEISELRIAPLGGTSLSINNELRLQNNIISTDVNDLLVRPNSGKKIIIDTDTSLVLPVGDINQRGAPIRGSVRFNTTILQYEGYDGTNWSSLGGVRDVDGNTYIIPETSAGSNENILYFYNNNSNTLRVTENQIEFDTIDTINSVTSNLLNLNAQLITFNNLAASIDTSGPNTFITTTQGNLDLGLASGLANDPLLRLSDTGDIYYNLGFGSGVYNGVKIFDSELKELEIADFKISTTKVTLTRNTVNSGSAVLYDPALHESAKVQIIAHNTITGSKEFVEYSVIDDGTDIFFTDFGNVKTGSELISCVFDFNVNNNVRVTFTLDTSVVSGNTVEVTIISNIIKR